jgi:glutamate dehydrogenase
MKSLKDIAAQSPLQEIDLQKIEDIILGHGRYTREAVRQELEWFCAGLAMSDYYFRTTPLETIALHIEAIMAAEILTRLQQEKIVKVDLGTERENGAIYLVDDYHFRAKEIEKRIEDRYPHFRLQTYRTLCQALGLEHLRIYLVQQPSFAPDRMTPEETDLAKIADQSFLAAIPKETYARYQDFLNRAQGWESPLIDICHEPKTRELLITVVANRDSSPNFFSNISDVLHSHGLHSNRKYIEQFSNGKTVFSIYLNDIEDQSLVDDLVEDISLVYVILDSPLAALFREGKLSAQETVFGVSLWSFAHQFLSSYNEEYLKLAEELQASPELLGLLRTLKTKLAKETFTETRVWDALCDNTDSLKKLFSVFDKKFNPHHKSWSVESELISLGKDIQRQVSLETDRTILHAGLLLISVILRTNFYKKDKTSLAYMYDPSFLNPVDYPVKPFGLVHILAAEMVGFHIRFRDIARGGIRIVRSVNLQNYHANSDSIFDENYNLALTQQKKNKDLPEGGSKGTILLRWGFQDKSVSAFKKYVDGLLDLMLPDDSAVDGHGQPLLLFLGPDEGTADFMEWAAFRAKAYGYPYWKSFSTGKPLSMGGIPHDLYGMTTHSVHQYVIRSLEKLGLKEEQITKVMTGGPDGDLGSNEILISKDRILAVIDGSGVLYDPQGINRPELERLARERKMVENFSRVKISESGFLVTVKDGDSVLPDGEKVEKGLDFRNTFHLNPKFKADLFVPCGGRPSSINISNWREWIDDKGQPRFKVIVEGANLFITQEARLRLEEKGVILYKDASANKGGVTSSSLEVLASLALSDEEYEQLMCVRDGRVSDFRRRYVEEIIEIVKDNAAAEFETIWKANAVKKIPRAVLTDLLSEKINQIKDAVATSDLASNEALFASALRCCIPKVLIKMVGFERILERVPHSYQKALFASALASQYVYRYGLEANEINFYDFVKEIQK